MVVDTLLVRFKVTRDGHDVSAEQGNLGEEFRLVRVPPDELVELRDELPRERGDHIVAVAVDDGADNRPPALPRLRDVYLLDECRYEVVLVIRREAGIGLETDEFAADSLGTGEEVDTDISGCQILAEPEQLPAVVTVAESVIDDFPPHAGLPVRGHALPGGRVVFEFQVLAGIITYQYAVMAGLGTYLRLAVAPVVPEQEVYGPDGLARTEVESDAVRGADGRVPAELTVSQGLPRLPYAGRRAEDMVALAVFRAQRRACHTHLGAVLFACEG